MDRACGRSFGRVAEFQPAAARYGRLGPLRLDRAGLLRSSQYAGRYPAPTGGTFHSLGCGALTVRFRTAFAGHGGY